MRVKSWMTAPVITVVQDDSMMKASKLMKDHNIRRLPVIDTDGKLIGIVSDRDIKEASPSKATTLDVHELYYLLSEIKVKDIMTKQPLHLTVNDTVEKGAVMMYEKHIGGLPIVDEADKVVGIFTESDLMRVYIDITRVRDGGIQMGFKLPRTPGALKPIMVELTERGAKLLSIFTIYPPGVEHRNVYMRIADMDKSELNKIESELASKYDLLFWLRDNVGSLV